MIIGLSGYARSGKDTIADILVKEHGFVKLAFADPMREALRRINPFIEVNDIQHMPLDQALRVYSWEDLKQESPDIRGLMQRIGTEMGREMFGENIWVELAIKEANKYKKPIVMSDTRFKNEAEAIRNSGGFVVRVERPGVEAANSHVSEHDLDGYEFDVTIQNTGTLEDLYTDVSEAVKAFGA
jgi:hypothetical protein